MSGQLLLWDDACDPELDNVRGLALDVEDWLRIWLHRPVGLADWSARLRPHLDPDVNERQWLRFRARLRHNGVPHEETEHDCPGQARLIRVALPPAALEWAKETLERGVDPDDTDEDSMETAYRMEPEEALRDEPIGTDDPITTPAALEATSRIEAYMAAVEEAAKLGKVDRLLMQEVLTIAAATNNLAVRLSEIARDAWLPGVGSEVSVFLRTSRRAQVLRHVVRAAGMTISELDGVEVCWSEEAKELLSELVEEILTERWEAEAQERERIIAEQAMEGWE